MAWETRIFVVIDETVVPGSLWDDLCLLLRSVVFSFPRNDQDLFTATEASKLTTIARPEEPYEALFVSSDVEERVDLYLALPPPMCHHVGLKLRGEKKAEVKYVVQETVRTTSDNCSHTIAALWRKEKGKLKHGFQKRKKIAEFLSSEASLRDSTAIGQVSQMLLAGKHLDLCTSLLSDGGKRTSSVERQEDLSGSDDDDDSRNAIRDTVRRYLAASQIITKKSRRCDAITAPPTSNGKGSPVDIEETKVVMRLSDSSPELCYLSYAAESVSSERTIASIGNYWAQLSATLGNNSQERATDVKCVSARLTELLSGNAHLIAAIKDCVLMSYPESVWYSLLKLKGGSQCTASVKSSI